MIAWLALCLVAGSAHAITINGSDSGTLSGSPVDALVDGYDASNDSAPSSFNQNLLNLTDETKDSVAITFSDGGYVDIGGVAYLPLVYDLQETNSNEFVTIGTLRLCLDAACGDTGSTEVWASTEDILLNTDQDDLTLKPLGNGADMAVFVPLGVFDGFGLKGTDTFYFEATQSDSGDGADEWILSDEGLAGIYTSVAFNPEDDINSSIIPEPGTLLLLGTGLAGLGALGRRRSTAAPSRP